MLIPVSVVSSGASFTDLSAYKNVVLADSPVGFWPFDEQSGLAQDASGNGNHMTTSAGVKIYSFPGPGGGRSILFPGESYFTRTIISTAINDFTIEFWIKLLADAEGSENHFYFSGEGHNGGIRLLFPGDNPPGIQALAHFVGYLAKSTAKLDPAAAAWQHWVIRRSSTDSNRWSYWVNGQVDTANAGTDTPIAATAGDTLHIGPYIQGNAMACAMFATLRLRTEQCPDRCSLRGDACGMT